LSSERESDRRESVARGRVLIVGAGALGSAAAQALAAAGVGTLVLLDPDRVEVSNLHRQPLHRTSGLGTYKVLSARERLARAHPELAIEAHAEALDAGNLRRWFETVDFVIDATDGIEAKFLINDGAVAWRRRFSHAGVLGLAGQTLTVLPGETACLRCLFPEPPPPDAVPTCQESGILGPVAGLIGAIQAAEAIRHLDGRGPALAGRLLAFDGRGPEWRQVAVSRSPRCPCCAELPHLATGGEPRYEN
jgi:molybdopterin-synthase adenylyltransferase